MELNELNDIQKEAVLKTEGPTLILAGAGSGKTRVLTTKVAYLIEDKKVEPYNILAITFTNKAAKEMKERIYNIVGSIANSIQISTFHSFGVKILRTNYAVLGYDKNFTIMDSDDSLGIIKKILKEEGQDYKIYSPGEIKQTISSCKNELVSPDEYSKYAKDDFQKMVLTIYKRYEELLKKNNAVDFDDLLILPIKLFKENKHILEYYQNQYKYILIDEYQDTNEAQYLLTKMISKKYKNICCVGDVDQSIYSFRGANYRNILNFEKDYPEAKVIKLEQNYRSTSIILDAANDVIKNNKERKDKNLWSNKGTGDKITYYRATNGIDEAKYIVNEIKRLADSGIDYEDIAILYRTNAQSRSLEDEFLRSNVPYKIIGGISFYARKEIKDLLAYLRLINNDKDDISLLRIINTPKRGIGKKAIEDLEKRANKNYLSLYEALETKKEMAFKSIVENLKKESNSLTLTQLIDKILSITRLEEEYGEEDSLERELRLDNIEEFKTITKTFEERDGIVSLEDFLLEISLITDISEYKDIKEAVSLMTTHAVKGLEFDYVFISGFEENIFPHLNSLSSFTALEEERRLCYVAITRAREKLYITNARMRILFGKDAVNLPSRFISEINSDRIDGEVEKIEIQEEKIDIEEKFYKEDTEYEIGDNVHHDVFGIGKVVSLSGSLVSVAFKHPYGIKQLIKNHKSLNKL